MSGGVRGRGLVTPSYSIYCNWFLFIHKFSNLIPYMLCRCMGKVLNSYMQTKNKQERGGFMRKNLKKGIGTLLFCILIAEGVTACGGPASSSTTTAKVDETGTREVEEEVKVDETEEVQRGCILAAKEYIDSQMPEEKDNITNFSTPSVVLLDKEPEGYYECIKNYKPKGKIYKVTFNTKDDAVLGPIVCFVDEEDVVFGLGWRE